MRSALIVSNGTPRVRCACANHARCFMSLLWATRLFCFSRNETSSGTCAARLICSKCHSPYRGRDIIRGINPSARALTCLIPLKTKHTHLLTYNNFLRLVMPALFSEVDTFIPSMHPGLCIYPVQRPYGELPPAH